MSGAMKAVCVVGVCGVVAASWVAPSSGHALASAVNVSTGGTIEVAVVVDPAAVWGAGVVNAVDMALAGQSVDGASFRADVYDAPCSADPSDVAANLATAQQVVGNGSIVAVVGHGCSYQSAGTPVARGAAGSCATPVSPSALGTYEANGIPTISGSMTNRCVPAVGPTMFNRTAVIDPFFDAWYKAVQRTSTDTSWRAAYTMEFGIAPTDFADLYYDATSVLVRAIRSAAVTTAGGISIDRSAVASALRHTSGFPGVTCEVDIDPATGNRVFQMPSRACTR